MLQLSPQTRILLATEPVDFRKGIDGLAAVCRRVLLEQPLGGTVFVFRKRAGTPLKLLCYDGRGFWLCTKRLSQGRFTWWPEALPPRSCLGWTRSPLHLHHHRCRGTLRMEQQVEPAVS